MALLFIMDGSYLKIDIQFINTTYIISKSCNIESSNESIICNRYFTEIELGRPLFRIIRIILRIPIKRKTWSSRLAT